MSGFFTIRSCVLHFWSRGICEIAVPRSRDVSPLIKWDNRGKGNYTLGKKKEWSRGGTRQNTKRLGSKSPPNPAVTAWWSIRTWLMSFRYTFCAAGIVFVCAGRKIVRRPSFPPCNCEANARSRSLPWDKWQLDFNDCQSTVETEEHDNVLQWDLSLKTF